MRNISPKSRFSSAHQNMNSAVLSFVFNAANLDTTSSIAAFLSIMGLIKNNLAAIISLQGSIYTPVTGIAEQKAVLRNSLVQTSTLIMQTVYAYAMKTGNSELAAQMKITTSKFERMKDSVLMGAVAGAIANVTAVLPQLVAYNITQDVVDLWTETLASFKDIVSNPKVAHDEVDVNRNKVQDFLRENMILLYNQADTISLQFKKDNLSYYRGYRKARKIIPLVKHTKMRVLATTEVGQPVSGVMVRQNDSTNYVVTDVNGRADLYIEIPKEAAPGMNGVYNFTLTKDTLSMQTGEIVIKKGNTVTKNFVMKVDGFVLPEEVVVPTEKVTVEK